MGKIYKTYDASFKKKTIDFYLKEGMSYHTVSEKVGIDTKTIRLWVKRYNEQGMNGLEEKRGKSIGVGKGRPRTSHEDPEEKIKRLEAENMMLKKLLRMRKEG